MSVPWENTGDFVKLMLCPVGLPGKVGMALMTA